MASKTLLLDLPNELFPFIFQYLRSIDILKAFSDFQSHRLQALIQPFITRLDISQESNQWIQIYLPDVFTKHEIIALRLQMKHLPFIKEHLLSTNIQSIQVINWDFDFDFSQEVVDHLSRNLKKLSFAFAEIGENGDLARQLFRSDSQLEHLTIKDCVLAFYDDQIETCTRITHLSVELEGMHPVFIFIQHLPNLQKLKVKMISQDCIVQPAPNINGVKPCNTLRSVTFTGSIKYFDHFQSFFATFGSTIEFLSINIYLMYYTIDGTRLERELLDKMPHLSSFDLIIFSAACDDDPIEIETFQSFTWQQFNPVGYWNDIHAQQHTIFTLPYKSDRFEYFSSDFVSTCVSNRSVSLYFERVRTLSFINTTSLNLETFLFIQKVFPNVTTVELTDWIVHPLAESEEEEEEDEKEERDRSILFMSEDLLLDTSLQILSVTKFCVNLWSQCFDYKTFLRFLRLFPNLIDLELNIQHPFLHDLLKHKHENDLVETILARINQVKIISWHEKDTLTDAEIHYLFPKAGNIVKPLDSGFE